MPYIFCQIYDLKPYGIPQLNSAYVMSLSILLSAHRRYQLMSLLMVPRDCKHHVAPKYGLVHIATGDLLRAEITAASKNGKHAKKFMDKGKLVPDEIIVTMVKERLNDPDSQKKGWILDGYPQSSYQAIELKEFGFQPDLFILLEVPEEILVERVVGRRLDPITGKNFNLKYSPPETEEIVSSLTQCFDDTEENACIVNELINITILGYLSRKDYHSLFNFPTTYLQ
ncbi:Adenylate kinase 2, chloroplastic [Capsicum baccatum]|uniref:adenylate kinase n=1 Tax=Capsicum baccatum TaxID=33114 RepID=A0A2G2VHI9_CAPBA|nr:Adenylate kinase 2, chloroplastic [Capsicum baccatum]